MLKSLKTCVVALMVAIWTAAAAQTSQINGRVIDSDGEPLIGASVIAEGTQTGVSTDTNGEFTLKVAPGAMLKFSYIGYQPKTMKAAGNMTVVMESVNAALDEIVVVGVSMRKNDLTGSVAHVDSETLTERPVTTINEALQGRVTGVNVTSPLRPSDDASIRIRGTNTINSGTSPIYVVDGLVMGNDFSFFSSINVNDVESITVLKDASATAIYGSRGANGVIVVTTKKASGGKGSVTYDGWVSISRMGHRPETMNAQQTFELRRDAYANGYIYENPSADRQSYIDNTLMKPGFAFHEKELATYLDGKSYDWLDQVTQTGVQQNHHLQFTKSSQDVNMLLSLNLSDLKGVVKGTSQTKYSGRFNGDAMIFPWLKVGTATSFTYTKDKIGSDDVYNMALRYSNPLIDYAPYKDDATRHNKEYLMLFWRAESEDNNNYYNPFNSMEVRTDRTRYYLTSSNYLNIHPMEGLDIRSTFAINHSEQMWMRYIPSGIQESIRHYVGDARTDHQRYSYTQWQWDNTVQYDTHIDLHRINAMVGTSTSRNSNNWDKAMGRRFPSNDLSYYAIGAAADQATLWVDSDFTNNSLVSFLGRVNYNYDYRYFLTVTGRYDGSSKFAKGHKWGFMPSFSAAWDITNEAFMKEQTLLSKLKLRAGYGVTGNQDIASFAYVTLYTPTVSNGNASYVTDGRRGTPSLTWEKQKQTNIGVDVSMLNDRLSFSIDGFFINNSNLLMSHGLHYTSGYNTTIENIGEMRNNGFEFQVNATPIRTRDFQWNVSANLSFDRNKVTRLYSDVDEILSGDRTGNIFLNKPLNNIYTYKCGGIASEANREQWEGINFNGKTVGIGDLYALDISGPDGVPDGVVDLHDRYIYDDCDPDFYGGFSTDLHYKGLGLNAIFNYSVGGHAISTYYENLVGSTGLSYATPDLLDRWTETNQNAKFPRVIYNASSYVRYSPSETDRYIQSTSYLRLASLSLSYNLPANVLKTLRLNSLRVYFTANNVFTITGYKGFDPEYGDYNYPPTRSYTFGLNFTI